LNRAGTVCETERLHLPPRGGGGIKLPTGGGLKLPKLDAGAP